MKNNQNILILNTGGTFNKVYDEIKGHLIVPSDNNALNEVLTKSKITNIDVSSLIHKDSLDINKNDRKELVKYIKNKKNKKIIIIHGTDTMNITATFLSKHIKNKTIILTGAMKPFSIDSVEATSNLMMAYGFLNQKCKNNIYISMHGLIKKHSHIIKNRQLGVFEWIK